MDARDLAARTGWTVSHLAVAASTNDAATRLAAQGAPARTVVVADRQTAGRGREGRRFASPAGGLYASLLLDARPEDLPAGVVALVALAAAEAVEAVSGCPTEIKWPNDLWIAGRKVGGILLERADGRRPVTAGVGINLRAVPAELPDDVRVLTGAVDAAAGRRVGRVALLEVLLGAVDTWQERLRAKGGAEALAEAWRGRLALVGEAIACTLAGARLEGVLEDVSLAEGLLIRDAVSGPVWRPAEHVQDLGPADRTIS